MPLTSKYATLIDYLKSLKIDQLDIHETADVLHISGILYSVDSKHKAWDLYHQIDPNYISEDLNLSLTVQTDEILKAVEVNNVDKASVALHRGPGVNQPVVAELNNGHVVEILGLTSQNWCLVRANKEVEGYCYIDYLSM